MGFKTYRRPIALTAQETAANLSIVLEVEGSTQTVEVTADALAAETTSTQLGENLDNKKIESVPLNGRSFTDLMAVQPGIVPQNTAQPGAVIMKCRCAGRQGCRPVARNICPTGPSSGIG